MNTPLLIFMAIELAGCAFLIYFLCALWRDGRKPRKGPPVEIRFASPERIKAKVIPLYAAGELRTQKTRRAASSK